MNLRAAALCAVLSAALLSLAALAGCAQAGAGAPQPGDSNYVPSGWTAPTLAYSRSAYLPAAVVDYKQAPGVHARNASFRLLGNVSRILDFPDGGGTYAPNNDTVVSLGMAGGYVTLEFSPALANYAAAADFIVYGNAYYSGGSSELVWHEPGTVWVMEDTNGNGLSDDVWYLLRPAYKASTVDGWTYITGENADFRTIGYDKADFPDSWWPEEAASAAALSFENVLVLPDSLYSYSGTSIMLRGTADSAPTLLRGDLSGTGSRNLSGEDDNTTDGADDYPSIDPVHFYTVPDNTPDDRDIDAKSGGGAAMDIDWAVDPANSFAAVDMSGKSVRWVKIVSGTALVAKNAQGDFLSDYSCEVDAVVRAPAP